MYCSTRNVLRDEWALWFIKACWDALQMLSEATFMAIFIETYVKENLTYDFSLLCCNQRRL